jgi:hypothetical protein
VNRTDSFMSDTPISPPPDPKPLLPVEVEFYIEADGTVVFADLAADLVPIAQELNPEQPLVCDVPTPKLPESEEEV